jgi:CubicO group peptidase (beta-lactamase class C family)
MENTKFYIPKENKSHLAALYFLDENKQLQLLDDPDITKKIDGDAPPKLLLGGAGLISSMTDYEKFCRMLLNKGTLNGKRILSEKSVSLIMTNQFSEELKSMTTMAHGLSGTVNPKNGEYHWGGAASTSFWINPTDNLIVICYTQLFNSQTQYANEFKATVESALLDK